MSIKLMSAVWDTKIPCAQKILLLSLADQANDDGICWPSIPTLAARCSRSERDIYRQLDELEKTGYIIRKSRNGKSTVYQVTDPASWRQDVTPDTLSGTTDTLSPPPLTPCQVPLTPCHPNHQESKGRSNNDPLARKRAERQKDPIWDAVIEACGLTGATPTKTERGAWNKAVKDLRDCGATPEEIRRRAEAYRKKWPEVSLTPTALARRWSECVAGEPSKQRAIKYPPDFWLPNGHMNPKYEGTELARTIS